MKKIENNPMIIGFLFTIGIFVLLISYLVFSLYPSVLDIESKKVELKDKISYYNRLKTKGFDFNEFKLLNSKNISSFSNKKLKELLSDSFYKTIYKEFDKDFYEHSIYGTGYLLFDQKKDFLEYLSARNKDLENIISGQEFSNKILKIAKVLPKYSNFIEFNDSRGLSDLAFVNYIENLLNKFNLKTNDSIGIKDIIPVDNDLVTGDNNIYYIPLSLQLKGTKLSILDFLKYIKNTGDVKFIGDDFDFSNKIGSTSQISEVEKLELKKYIDNSYDIRESIDYSLDRFLVKTNQGNDIITVKVDLKFYVSGISSDKIKNRINFIIGNNNKKVIFDKHGNPKKDEKTGETKYELVHYNYYNIFNISKKFRSNSFINKNNYYKRKVNYIFKYLNSKELKKDLNSLRKELSKSKNINDTYKKALIYKEIFSKLDKELYGISKSLGLDIDKVDEKTGKIIQKSIYPKDYIFD